MIVVSVRFVRSYCTGQYTNLFVAAKSRGLLGGIAYSTLQVVCPKTDCKHCLRRPKFLYTHPVNCRICESNNCCLFVKILSDITSEFALLAYYGTYVKTPSANPSILSFLTSMEYTVVTFRTCRQSHNTVSNP